MAVMLETSLGEIVIDLFTDDCPVTTKNFLKLCKLRYYNHCLFFDVQKDFIVQTGDPSNTGKGGQSVYELLYGEQAHFFDDEILPKLKHDKIGVVAMASAGENKNASQFYITTRAGLDYLDGKHTIFGEVGEGIEALLRINEAYVDEKGRPYKNIRIRHTHVLDDPFPDPPGLAALIPDSSPPPPPPPPGEDVRLEDDWVPMDEGKAPEEVERLVKEREAHSRAVVLEMIGDLPDAEIKPPENVLFICKLNPVTQDEDLEIIFSRFGRVVSADIIRDFKTGDSLCYGFIEFETQQACEAAYFKMDNVLIDDRRIHVDFSQSVSKLWTRFRRFGAKDTDQGAGQGAAKGGSNRGCFKCGQPGHFAKNCPHEGGGGKEKGRDEEDEDGEEGEEGEEGRRPKLLLKEGGEFGKGQRGSTGKSYGMVFDDGSGEEDEKREEDRGRTEKVRREEKRRDEELHREGRRGKRSREEREARDVGREGDKRFGGNDERRRGHDFGREERHKRYGEDERGSSRRKAEVKESRREPEKKPYQRHEDVKRYDHETSRGIGDGQKRRKGNEDGDGRNSYRSREHDERREFSRRGRGEDELEARDWKKHHTSKR